MVPERCYLPCRYGNRLPEKQLSGCHNDVKKTFHCRAVSLCFWWDSASFLCLWNVKKVILHPILHRILHPILHPKISAKTGNLYVWCRKCRFFFQNFFWGRGGKYCSFFGICWEKPLSPSAARNVWIRQWGNRKSKTSDFFDGNLRTFEAKHRNFSPKKSDVFEFRKGLWLFCIV